MLDGRLFLQFSTNISPLQKLPFLLLQSPVDEIKHARLQEMRWNPIFDAWSFLRLDAAYGTLMRRMPGPLFWLMWNVRQPPSRCAVSLSLCVSLCLCGLSLSLSLFLPLSLSPSLPLSLSPPLPLPLSLPRGLSFALGVSEHARAAAVCSHAGTTDRPPDRK